MSKPDILIVLEDALKAHEAGDYSNALEFYEKFFDHALDDDPYALYAVRFSHCLSGWGELALVFPGAKRRLEQKRKEVWDDYYQDRVAERFFDYLNICRQLGLEQEALESFLNLHADEPKSAIKLTRYIWDELIISEHWQVCGELLVEPAQKIDELFSIFEESDQLRKIDPSFDDPKFDKHIVDTLISDLQQVVMVLRQNGRAQELPEVERQFMLAVDKSGHALLQKQVHAKAAFLFAGH